MDSIIVGGGLAGLCCARTLHAAGKEFVLIEASDRLGGRVATDEVDGFLLDRGFQVFLTAYPEAQDVLDYTALDLKAFEPGALCYHGGKFHRLSDPWRSPQHLVPTALSGAATFADKLRVAWLRRQVSRGTLDELYARPETSTLARLESCGFSHQIMDRFFRPFLSGIFLEPDLATSSRMFEFVFRLFGQGDAALPSRGMQAIPQQIARGLPEDSIRLETRVTAIDDQTVSLESGETLEAPHIVLACDNPHASRLADVPARDACGVTCLYLVADKPPIDESILILNGERQGPINNLCFPNLVSWKYASQGGTLVSATVLGADHPPSLLDEVIDQLATWFGPAARSYSHLRTYSIPFALPSQTTLNPVEKTVQVRPGLYRCGDDMDTASINGAMVAGRRAAECLLAALD